MDESSEVTRLLNEIRAGNLEAEGKLLPLVYTELNRLARIQMSQERGGHTLQTTALVHEAFLRLTGNRDIDWSNRNHFFAVAATLMRRVLVDYARSRQTEKRGGGLTPVELHENIALSEETLDSILSVHQALDRLEVQDERAARVVELKFFSGLDFNEIGEVLGVSSRTAKRDWDFAQSWLYEHMSA